MKRIEEVLSWKVTDISLRPFRKMWSINPSIHFDGEIWRCVLRCTDYAMPGGVTVRSDKAKPGQSCTKNAMVIFDPDGWKPVELYKMREEDDLPRARTGSVGYEDVRLFRTDRHGLQGIAASLHLRRSDRRDQIAEQVLLSFGDEYDIVDARPIRGGWSGTPQKNWVPFDHCAEPRFLYAIDRGTMFDDRGELVGTDAVVLPSTRPRRFHAPDDREIERARERAAEAEEDRLHDRRRERSRDAEDPRLADRRGEPTVAMPPESFLGLRGGSQLVRVGKDEWLGIGHSMAIVDKLKYYWHVWYLVDSRGKLTAASGPMKLAPNGIEFAAGMAIDGDRVVVSFGIDDMECRLGETSLAAVRDILQPIRAVVR